ncbi:CLUMA_CG018276, isoform A, partial [Clunio marinus]
MMHSLEEMYRGRERDDPERIVWSQSRLKYTKNLIMKCSYYEAAQNTRQTTIRCSNMF